jgi:hypothetical protein
VVFEVLSPSNRYGKMQAKFLFYERYGVEEYYIYDPDNAELFGWLREGDHLRAIADMQGWSSPRLKVRMELHESELRLSGPDGRPFASYVELIQQRDQAERERNQLEQAADRLRAQLRALGINPEA